MKIIYHAPKEVQDFFNECASVVYSGETYYYMPYWFKLLEGDKFEMIPLDRLPRELVNIIEDNRK